MPRAPGGDGMVVARFPQPLPGLRFNLHDEPVVCSRRGDLISNVPPGQVAAFPALTLDMQCSRRFEVEDFAKHVPKRTCGSCGSTSLRGRIACNLPTPPSKTSEFAASGRRLWKYRIGARAPDSQFGRAR